MTVQLRDPLAPPGGLVYHGIERPWRLEDHIDRDHKGRPRILLVDEQGRPTGEQATYTRVTTFIAGVDDKTNLQAWRRRQVAKGMATRPTVYAAQVAAAVGAEDERDILDNLTEEMEAVAGARDGADLGTAFHALTERHDLGMPTPFMPDEIAADNREWVRLTRGLEMAFIEQFMVNDELRTGGTPDRIIALRQPCPTCGGRYRILDLKTGRVDHFTLLYIAMQLSVYAHSRCYDHETGRRLDGMALCTCTGWVVNITVTTGRGELLTIPLADGWHVAQTVIPPLRKARNIKVKATRVDVLAKHIAMANSREELQALWVEAEDRWTEEHTDLAQQRLSQMA